MVWSRATSVTQYLAELPPERRAVVERVRQLILDNLPAGYVESVTWGMLSYEVPLGRYPDTYNRQPLGYVALAAQKHHYSLYLMAVYQDPAKLEALRDGFGRECKKLDMGKSCVRFKRLGDLALDAIAQAIASTPVEDFVAAYERSRSAPGRARAGKKIKRGKKR